MSANDNPQSTGTVNPRKPGEPVSEISRSSWTAAATAPSAERPERRRQVDPTTCERDYNDEEIVFMKSMDNYKRDNRRPFPTWSEVLEVLRALGYRKVADATALPGNTRPIDLPPKG